jgi:hypothetical protein
MDDASHAPVASARPLDALEVLQPLFEVRGGLRFLAGLAIASGVLNCLTIVGLLYGWIPIWLGTLLWRTADRLESGRKSGDAQELRAGLQSLATAIRIKVALALLIIVLTLTVLGFLVAVAIGAAVQGL